MLVTHLLKDSSRDANGEDDDGGPVEGQDVLGHVTLAQTRGRSGFWTSKEPCANFQQARDYPWNIDALGDSIGKPELHFLTLECVAAQLHKSPDELHQIDGKISVFHSAVATFFSPSDPSGIHGMRRERICSTPSWRGCEARHNCAFVVEDDTKPGMMGMNVVRVKLFFSFEYDGESYPCALVEWFGRVGCDPVTGLWMVCPDITRGQRDISVLHVDAFLRSAHLIPVYGSEKLPLDFHYSYSLDAFNTFYVNKYIDHHANEIAF